MFDKIFHCIREGCISIIHCRLHDLKRQIVLSGTTSYMPSPITFVSGPTIAIVSCVLRIFCLMFIHNLHFVVFVNGLIFNSGSGILRKIIVTLNCTLNVDKIGDHHALVKFLEPFPHFSR